jgi:serine/threonine protein kinase
MFQSPEMLDENIDELEILKNATKLDIWSAGITLYQLTTGNLPFEGSTIHQIFEMIRSNQHKIKMHSYMDKNLINLLNGMLAKNPSERISIEQIRLSEWFKKKHPQVKEEMAILPSEVAQNELLKFRMINYLEKYCQKQVEENSENKLNRIKQSHDCYKETDLQTDNLASESVIRSQHQLKIYNPMAKEKRTNCILM